MMEEAENEGGKEEKRKEGKNNGQTVTTIRQLFSVGHRSCLLSDVAQRNASHRFYIALTSDDQQTALAIHGAVPHDLSTHVRH
jgi:hypothetical protein